MDYYSYVDEDTESSHRCNIREKKSEEAYGGSEEEGERVGNNEI